MFLTAIKKNIDLTNPQKKIILTQNYINPGILKRNLALEYGSIANLSILPFREFVLNHSIAFFNDNKYFSHNNHFWAFYSILNELRSKLSYFYEAVEFESLSLKLLSLIEDLELNNVSEKEIYQLGEESNNLRKWEEIILIQKAYQKYKIKNDLYDYADGIKQLINNKIEFENTYIIEFNKSKLEDDLIKSSGISSIKQNEELDFKYELSGYKVDTSNQEVQQTVRNIIKDLESIEPPVKIGICVPDYDSAYYKFKTQLAKISQSEFIHYGKGIPFFDTSPGKFFAYLKDWVNNEFTVNILLRLLSSGYINTTCFGDYDYKDYLTALSYFRNSKILLFDENFQDAFFAYLEGKIKKEEEEIESLVPDAVVIAKNITSKFQFLISNDSLQDKLIKLNELFNQLIHTSNKNDNVALVKIQNFAEDFINSEFMDNTDFNILDFLSLATEHLDNIHVGVTLPDYTKPILGTVKDLIYYHFDKLYVLGLNEIGLPKKLFQNPLILDSEIDLISKINSRAKILKTIDRQLENDTQFRNLKSIVEEELVLSAPLKDLTSGREYLVSRYMLDEWERYYQNSGKDINYKSISADLSKNENSKNNFVCEIPTESFYLYETAVSLGMKNINNKLINFELEHYFPVTESVRKYKENYKRGDCFNEYWGFLDLSAERELPVFSSSRLTSWVNCPYQYFLKYELKLKKKDEFDAYNLEWLDILSYGSFLHELYFNFFMNLRDRNFSEINKVKIDDKHLFDEEFNKLVEKYKILYPVKSEIHFELQYNKLTQVASQFFENELLNNNTRKYFELSFGMVNREGRDTSLSLEEPAKIELNDGSLLQVRGSIDRIDVVSENEFLLIDYKTGKPKTQNPSVPFDGGRFIQAGIYPLIADQIVKEISNPKFEYYYTNYEYGIEKLSFGSLDAEHFKELLTSIVKQIRKGNFVPSGTDTRYGICPYCDYKEECLKGRMLLAKRNKASDVNYDNYKNITAEKLDEII